MSGPPDGVPLPPDDLARKIVHARPDEDPNLRHVAIGGSTYTFLVTGAETVGRYCLIDMHVPPGSGPPPHRHDFEEMFTLLEGAVEFTFRGDRSVVRRGETVSIPANAPHFFHNSFDELARLLCMCTPAGQEEFFAAIGDVVAGRTGPPPTLSAAEQDERRSKAEALVARYRTELLLG